MAGSSRIRTGRTWRDLPPAPPAVQGPIPEWRVESDVPVEQVTAGGRPRIWPWVMAGVAVVALGFAVGAWLGNGTSSDEPRPAALEAEPDVTQPSVLPDEIIPPLPPDSTTPDGSLVEPTVPDDLEPPTLDIPGLGEDVLFTVPNPPAGYVQSQSGLGVGPGGVEQKVVLSSADGDITIVGSLEPAAQLPSGPTVDVGDTQGVWADDTTVVWIHEPLLLMEISGSGDVSQDVLLDVASGLEFT